MGTKRVKIYRWRRDGSKYGNFGDEITIPLLAKIFGIEAVPSPMRSAELLGAGSILDSWTNSGRKKRIMSHFTLNRSADLHVWGAGMIIPTKPTWPQQLHVHAVRGSLTANELGSTAVLGDPGILASLLIEPAQAKRHAVAFVPNHTDYQFVRSRMQLPENWLLIDPEMPVEHVLTEIASSDLVVSSSLHGIITADSFQIPCVWLKSHNPLAGNSVFKFYYYATSRGYALNEPLTYQQIVQMNVSKIAEISTTAKRGIRQWQEDLITAFPFG